MPDETLLTQLHDIQANVVKGNAWRHARYHLLRIEEPEKFRRALAAALEEFPIASAADFWHGSARRERAVNVAFSHRGLQAMGVAQPFLESFPEPFREGMAARVDRLGDDGESAPEHWDRWLGTEDVHVLVALFFAKEVDFDAAWRKFVETAGADVSSVGPGEPCLPGARHLLMEKGDQLLDDLGVPREHFGFRDGVSQPALADGVTPCAGGGWIDENGTWQPIATGEFLLGHRDMDGFDQLEQTPALRALCQNGTYLVFRKLRQHVDRFRKFLDENFQLEQRELAAARMIGRWHDGHPLVTHPKKPQEPPSQQTANDFRYEGDPDGRICPVTAHMRRVNPRDAHRDRDLDPRAVARRRIIRRGFTYGSASDEDKGLLFVCLNAKIDSQFEFLQEEWINRGDSIGEGSRSRDPLVGSHQGERELLRTGPARFAALPRFVTMRGGEYFFLPGVKALRELLAGRYGLMVGSLLRTQSFNAKQVAPPAPSPPQRRDTDPVRHPERLDLERLHRTREVEQLRAEWIALDGTRRERDWYYVVGYDQVLEVLEDEARFSVDHNRRRLYELLRDPGAEQQEFERQMLLGLPGGDPEKEERHRMLRSALGTGSHAGSIPELFAALGQKLEALAHGVSEQVIGSRRHLDVARELARTVPIQRISRIYGISLPTAISDLQKAWHFRQLLDGDRKWLREVRSALEAEGMGRAPGLDRGLRFEKLGWELPQLGAPRHPDEIGIRELGFLTQVTAIELLIDVYDSGELFDIGRLAMRELRRHVSECVDRAEAQGARDATLLSALLAKAPGRGDAARADYLTRVKLLLLELIVGGVETPAKGITNTIDGLLLYPEAMAMAREAVDRGDTAALDRVIHEVLRLDPVAFLVYRECPDGATLRTANGLRVAPGSMVALVLRHAYRDPEAFEDPAIFLPTRGRRTDDPSFGRSPHECVGELIAMAEIRGVVRALLEGYELQRVPGAAGRKEERFRFPTSLGIKLYPRSR